MTRTRHTWTQQDDQLLIRLYPDTLGSEIAEQLGVTLSCIYRRAFTLGLKKSEKFNERIRFGEFNRQSEKSKEYHFKKGFTPWNKGLKGFNKGNQSVFTSGHKPHNTKHDGAITLRYSRKEKGKPYQYIRLSEGEWIPLHVKVYEELHGKVPPGHLVVFKDGNRMNCEPENLECISKAENMIRNTIHRYPPELESSIRILKKLTKTIKQHEEKQHE